MRGKLIAILFLTIYAMDVTLLKELLKIPILIEHFIEHKGQDKAIDFAGFLSLHYFNGDPQDEDYERDMQLPFKSLSLCHAFVAPCVSLPTGIEVKKPELPEHDNKKQSYNELGYTSQYLSAIWQPPRLA